MDARAVAAMLGIMGVFAVPGAPRALPSPLPVQLTANGRATMPVCTGVSATERTCRAARTLAEYLERISGAAVSVENGDGSRGIVAGLPGDFDRLPFAPVFEEGPFAREQYLLRSGPGGLWLLGATELAVEDAVWDVLYRLGYRQFCPGKTWEVILRSSRDGRRGARPSASTITSA